MTISLSEGLAWRVLVLLTSTTFCYQHFSGFLQEYNAAVQQLHKLSEMLNQTHVSAFAVSTTVRPFSQPPPVLSGGMSKVEHSPLPMNFTGNFAESIKLEPQSHNAVDSMESHNKSKHKWQNRHHLIHSNARSQNRTPPVPEMNDKPIQTKSNDPRNDPAHSRNNSLNRKHINEGYKSTGNPKDQNTTGNQLFLIPPKGPDTTAATRVRQFLGDDYNMTVRDRNCGITSQVKLVTSHPNWMLHTLDEDGRLKTVGGDELYVSYQDSKAKDITAAAMVEDLYNGSYNLHFMTTPLDPEPANLTGMGVLKISFIYSCGIGSIPRPKRDKWLTNGATKLTYSILSVPEPPMTPFIFPNSLTGNYNTTQRQPLIDLGAFSQVISFGDSLNREFVLNSYEDKNHHAPSQTNVVFIQEAFPGKTGSLGTESLPRFLENLEIYHDYHLKTPNTALIVGSSAWDVLKRTDPINATIGWDPNFEDHFVAAKRYVQTLRQQYPNVTVMWKLGEALHAQNYNERACGFFKCRQRMKYISNSRVRLLYHGQKQIMQELGIPVLDLYNMTYLLAAHNIPGDTIHYDPYGLLKLSYFYPRDVAFHQYVARALGGLPQTALPTGALWNSTHYPEYVPVTRPPESLQANENSDEKTATRADDGRDQRPVASKTNQGKGDSGVNSVGGNANIVNFRDKTHHATKKTQHLGIADNEAKVDDGLNSRQRERRKRLRIKRQRLQSETAAKSS